MIASYVEPLYNSSVIDVEYQCEFIYMLIDEGHIRYFIILNQNDQVVVKQQVNRKYTNLDLDPDGYGCWMFKKNDRDGILFIYNGSQLSIYEED